MHMGIYCKIVLMRRMAVYVIYVFHYKTIAKNLS